MSDVTNTEWSGPLVVTDAGTIIPVYCGQAVVVELLPGRYLFALLKGKKPDGDAVFWVYFADDLEAPSEVAEKTEAKNMAAIKRQPFDTPVPLSRVAPIRCLSPSTTSQSLKPCARLARTILMPRSDAPTKALPPFSMAGGGISHKNAPRARFCGRPERWPLQSLA